MSKGMVYLSGGQQFAADDGIGWRAEITPSLVSRGFSVYDPTIEEPIALKEAGRAWRNLVHTDIKKYISIGESFVTVDVQAMKDSEFIIAYWDEAAQAGSGTACELFWAKLNELPVYCVLDMPVERMSVWTLGCLEYEKIFPDFESCLQKIDEDYLGEARFNGFYHTSK